MFPSVTYFILECIVLRKEFPSLNSFCFFPCCEMFHFLPGSHFVFKWKSRFHLWRGIESTGYIFVGRGFHSWLAHLCNVWYIFLCAQWRVMGLYIGKYFWGLYHYELYFTMINPISFHAVQAWHEMFNPSAPLPILFRRSVLVEVCSDTSYLQC